VTPASPPSPPPEYVELAELAGRFIHDIKNHLSTLGLHLEILAEDFREPQTQRERRASERIDRLQTECQQLVDLSNDFLRFARIKDLELEPAELSEVVEELTDFFAPSARQNNIEIRCFIPTDLPTVRLDREMFKNALLNLLLNAQQAMPEGGTLTIQARAEPADAPSHVCLMLIDTGVGMTPEVAAKATRPFFSTKSGGNGLGLPTARKIVEAHGGRMELQSELGRGTKVTICLPLNGETI
jgi:two-component system, NtrC family, sensor histidine kinase HydH